MLRNTRNKLECALCCRSLQKRAKSSRYLLCGHPHCQRCVGKLGGKCAICHKDEINRLEPCPNCSYPVKLYQRRVCQGCYKTGCTACSVPLYKKDTVQSDLERDRVRCEVCSERWLHNNDPHTCDNCSHLLGEWKKKLICGHVFCHSCANHYNGFCTMCNPLHFENTAHCVTCDNPVAAASIMTCSECRNLCCHHCSIQICTRCRSEDGMCNCDTRQQTQFKCIGCVYDEADKLT